MNRTRSPQKSSPSPNVQRQKRSLLNMQNSSRKALFSDEEDSKSASSANDKNRLSTTAVTDELVVQNCQLATPIPQQSMAETISQPASLNSSSTIPTSEVSTKEVDLQADGRTALEIISNSGFNNPLVSSLVFISLIRTRFIVKVHIKTVRISGKCKAVNKS